MCVVQKLLRHVLMFHKSPVIIYCLIWYYYKGDNRLLIFCLAVSPCDQIISSSECATSTDFSPARRQTSSLTSGVLVWKRQAFSLFEVFVQAFFGFILMYTWIYSHNSGSANYVVGILYQLVLSTNNNYMTQEMVLICIRGSAIWKTLYCCNLAEK